MPDDWPTTFTQEALARVDAFIAERPEYTRDGVEQPHQGATNRVVFARRDGDLVVFKVFCNSERRDREWSALQHWQETGLVPELIWDADPRMIVTTHVRGVNLPAARDVHGEQAWRDACCDTGAAVGSLTRVPLSTADRGAFEARFYDGLGNLERYVGRIMELGRSIHRLDRDFQGSFWADSLGFVDAQLPFILGQPRILYHQDVGNLHVEHGRFMGFFDLEMCRVGSAAMQLGSSLAMLTGSKEGWECFRAGWEEATGAQLGAEARNAAAAVVHLLSWREISRYLSYDGTPGTGFAWASPGDPARYQRYIRQAEDMLELA